MPRRGVTCVGTDRATGSQRAWCAGTHLSWKWHWHLSGWEGKEKKGISRAQHCLMAISRDLLLLLAVCAAGRGRTGHYPVREGQGAAGGSRRQRPSPAPRREMLTASTSWSRGDAGAQHTVLSPGVFWQCGSSEPGLSEVRRDFRKLLLASLWTCLALVCSQLAVRFPHAFCQLFKRESASEGARFKVSALTLTQASAGSPPFLSFPPFAHNLPSPFQTQSAAEEQGRAPGSARSPWAGWSSTCWRLCLTPIVQPTWLPALQSALGQTGDDTKQGTEQATFVPLHLCAICARKRFLVVFEKRFPKSGKSTAGTDVVKLGCRSQPRASSGAIGVPPMWVSPSWLQAEVAVVPCSKVCTGLGMRHSLQSTAARREGDGKALKQRGQRPQRSTRATLRLCFSSPLATSLHQLCEALLATASATPDRQQQLVTAAAPSQDVLPRRQMGFIADDSAWNKNISPTSHSVFTESH